jgi:replicative DNA helicase
MTDPKLPPQNLDAEMSILGGILIDNDAINRVLESIVPEDFYRRCTARYFWR